MAERSKPKILFRDPPTPPFTETRQKLESLHKTKQEIDSAMTLMREKVELDIHVNGPVRIVPISDTHLFAVQSDYEKVREIFQKLDEPNTFGVLMGDLIEGALPGIPDHIHNVEIGFTEQIQAVRGIIEPYVNEGKILCSVGSYTGHEGWGDSKLGLDVPQLVVLGMRHPDGNPVKVLYNGGRLILHTKDGEVFSVLIYHAPGGGGSDDINPLGAQRERLRDHVSKRGSIDGAGGGDWHHRAGVSKELVVDLKEGKEKSYVLFANGTPKGNDPERPDTFLTKMSKGPTLGPGVQIILNHERKDQAEDRNGERVWASYGYNKGEVLYEAAKLLDKTEKQRHTKSLVGEIISHSKSPKADLDRRNSRTKVKDSRFDIPMYESFKWSIDASNNLPVLVSLLANARYTSTSFEKRDREKLKRILTQIEDNPFEFGLVMRHFIDPDVSKMFDREQVLDRMVDDLSKVSNAGRLLGIMMSSSLLDDRWNKDVLSEPYKVRERDSHGRMKTRWVRDRGSGFYPGEHIYKGFERKVPLYLNQSLMSLDFGNGVCYEFLLMDHLAHSGSEFDPFRGLVQARRKSLASSDIVAGGHMPGVGFMTTPDATYVAPGWFSEYESHGKSNRKRVPLGGQSVILFPRTKMVIPASTFLEATDIHTALMLYAGLDKDTKDKLLSKTK